MQALLYRPGRLSFAVRILLFFVSVLMIGLVNVQYVYAADTYPALLRINGHETSSTVQEPFIVYPSSYTPSIVKPGLPGGVDTLGNTAYYDFSIPLTIYCNHGKKSASYIDTVYFEFRIDASESCVLSDAYIDSDYVSLYSYTSLSNKFKKGSNTVGFTLSFYDLPFTYSFSQNFYLHLRLSKPVGQAWGIDLNGYITFNVYCPTKFNISSDNLNDMSLIGGVNDIGDTLDQQREEDRQDAEQGGEDAADLVTNLDGTIKSKWAILWYPLEFTQRVASVFGAGTSSASYKATYADVVDYRYDESSGYLVPVRDPVRAQARAGGTIISFPSFTMMGMQIWDSYDFDLSQLKSWFPELFNLLYVAVSILEVYWFVSFLRNKYDEVFG